MRRQDFDGKASAFSIELEDALEPGRTLRVKDKRTLESGYRTTPGEYHRPIEMPLRQAVVVGIDVRESTRRNSTGQLIIAALLNACTRKTVNLFRDHGHFSRSDPLVTVPTGDGGFLVFVVPEEVPPEKTPDGDEKVKEEGKSNKASEEERELRRQFERAKMETIQKALSFVLTFNTLMTEHNARETMQDESKASNMGVFPLYPRFAMTLDTLVLCLDLEEKTNVIGPAMLNCARILSTDKGNHFLVGENLLHACNPYGGLARVASAAGLGDWDAHFHWVELPDTKVKSGHFRYADVFGLYADKPLLRLRRMGSVRPVEYHIGSHDVLRIKE